MLKIIFTHKKFIYRIKNQGVCRYFLTAALNFAFEFLRIVTLSGRLENFCASIECTFLGKDRLAFGQ